MLLLTKSLQFRITTRQPRRIYPISLIYVLNTGLDRNLPHTGTPNYCYDYEQFYSQPLHPVDKQYKNDCRSLRHCLSVAFIGLPLRLSFSLAAVQWPHLGALRGPTPSFDSSTLDLNKSHSQLPQTDPRDARRYAHRVDHKSERSV